LEQGLAFGYTYDGFTVSRSQNVPNLDNFLKLSLATNAMSATDYRSTLNDLNAKFVNNRQQFDATIREMFHKIYAAIQYYNKSVDNVTDDKVQQVPNGDDTSGSPAGTAPKDV
jgi:hypothetical protein